MSYTPTGMPICLNAHFTYVNETVIIVFGMCNEILLQQILAKLTRPQNLRNHVLSLSESSLAFVEYE
jgi:hypothetical protein